ncbi:hypothetical protein E2320_002733 [Naja naja]|nr:hypothetical protein E2320_002733 [Naja naja]
MARLADSHSQQMRLWLASLPLAGSERRSLEGLNIIRPAWALQVKPWPLEPLHLRATFDGDPARLALFLNEVISHLNCYPHLYPSQRAMAEVVMAALEGEAAAWVADLYSENAQGWGMLACY